MENAIYQLPDHIANQIAAGEVIQRPASVIKELVENAVDAQSTLINVVIKDAGKTLIQVIDNGVGMSEPDARMAFERHATSKIKNANDLFHLTTMGFRGEALASIAAIANVTLITRHKDVELGCKIQISGSEIKQYDTLPCPQGANFQVKNLFFNVPARRKFLKADATEFKHIQDEFIKVALTRPDIHFKLTHNGIVVYDLPQSNIKQRIVNIFGKSHNENLIPIETDTSLINIKGFIGTSDLARKSSGEQYFFVNNRFLRHPYFYRAVMMAYENIIQKNYYPAFFIYLDVDPSKIDVNIHPTKTEIKFEDEKSIWQILLACLRESIGRYNLTPSIDFESTFQIELPSSKSKAPVYEPNIRVNTEYNPFNKTQKSINFPTENRTVQRQSNWESLYQEANNQFDTSNSPVQSEKKEPLDESKPIIDSAFFQIKQRYILVSVKSGVMLIDQKRAHERIIFDQFLRNIDNEKFSTQKSLFPEEYHSNPSSNEVLRDIVPELNKLGFIIKEYRKDYFMIEGVPGELSDLNPISLIDTLLSTIDEAMPNIKDSIVEQIASKLAQISSLKQNKLLSQEEMQDMTERLISSATPNVTPSGKVVLRILSLDEINKLLII